MGLWYVSCLISPSQVGGYPDEGTVRQTVGLRYSTVVPSSKDCGLSGLSFFGRLRRSGSVWVWVLTLTQILGEETREFDVGPVSLPSFL